MHIYTTHIVGKAGRLKTQARINAAILGQGFFFGKFQILLLKPSNDLMRLTHTVKGNGYLRSADFRCNHIYTIASQKHID